MTETLILVDAFDQEIGQGEKLQVHREGLLHRAFSIFIFDIKGRLLLQQRAADKYHSSNLWTNTCCGHPRAGEKTDVAARRRLKEEMGFSCDLKKVDTFVYRSPVSDDLVEHEFDHLYVGGYNGMLSPDPAEAANWQWIELENLYAWMEREPQKFTSWFKKIIHDPDRKFGREWLQIHAEQYTLSSLRRYQTALLMRVSSTYALAIPLLPSELMHVVTHAYLLLRIADTIEDEPALTPQQIRLYEESFIAAVKGLSDARHFSDTVGALLTAQTVAAEHELLLHLPLLLEVHGQLKSAHRESLLECLEVISRGMAEFRQSVSVDGLETRQELDRYCYCVSGSVGEMMTRFFIDLDPTLLAQRDKLLRLSVSLGAGLQLVNIIKDQWEDRERGVCWLPKDLFAEHGISLSALQRGQPDPNYARALAELMGTTHAHLQLALHYVLCIPARHIGIRHFLSFTIGLALLVLRKVQLNPFFCSSEQVNPSHAEVALLMRKVLRPKLSDQRLCTLFKMASRGLPFTSLDPEWKEEAYRVRPWPRSSISFLPSDRKK